MADLKQADHWDLLASVLGGGTLEKRAWPTNMAG